MASTAAQVAALRRKVAEPDSATYDDTTLAGYIEARPLIDVFGREPYQATAAYPPGLEANPDWTATYDLNAAAQEIWTEKAAALAVKFDFTTDGQTFTRSQMHKHALEQARYYGARRSASTIKLFPKPDIAQAPMAANVSSLTD